MLRKTEYVLKNLGNEHILVPTGGEVTNLNGILVLNDTALFIWKMLENEIDEKDLSNGKLWLLDEVHCFRTQILHLCNLKKKRNSNSIFNFEAGSIDTLIKIVDDNVCNPYNSSTIALYHTHNTKMLEICVNIVHQSSSKMNICFI